MVLRKFSEYALGEELLAFVKMCLGLTMNHFYFKVLEAGLRPNSAGGLYYVT